ncbi:MAG: hypothetical protein IPF99_35425 [Deltaproteobacteria bacterium]|nr:hypothetical protein [Deltaproteobacteria bacterium]
MPVQCRTDAECGGSLTCQRSPPGGICFGCSATMPCPSGLDCLPGIGACSRGCTTAADCAPGLDCSGLGRCVLRTCTPGDCPAPYVCDTTTSRCARPTCGGGTACPMPLVCSAGICVEP